MTTAGIISCGRAFTGVDVRVVDPDGRPLPAGIEGEVCVRGDVVMSGYWADPTATEQAIRDGWLHTGDIGRLDDRGYLFLTDRAKDVIITGGSNVYPREVEEALLAHPDVREVAVIGLPDPEWGESICAFVVLNPGASEDPAALIAHCKDQLASFKKPKNDRVRRRAPQERGRQGPQARVADSGNVANRARSAGGGCGGPVPRSRYDPESDGSRAGTGLLGGCCLRGGVGSRCQGRSRARRSKTRTSAQPTPSTATVPGPRALTQRVAAPEASLTTATGPAGGSAPASRRVSYQP